MVVVVMIANGNNGFWWWVFRQLDIFYFGNKSLAETVLEEASVDQVMLAATCNDPSTPALTLTPARSPPVQRPARPTTLFCTTRPAIQAPTTDCRAHHRQTGIHSTLAFLTFSLIISIS